MRRFRPGVAPTLVVLLLLPLLVSLGFWQLHRSEQKRLLLDSYAQRRTAEPLSRSEERRPDPAFRRVRLRGQFDAEHSYLLDNRMRNGRIGRASCRERV